MVIMQISYDVVVLSALIFTSPRVDRTIGWCEDLIRKTLCALKFEADRRINMKSLAEGILLQKVCFCWVGQFDSYLLPSDWYWKGLQVLRCQSVLQHWWLDEDGEPAANKLGCFAGAKASRAACSGDGLVLLPTRPAGSSRSLIFLSPF